VALLVQCLPVLGIPEQLHITPMWSDMVDNL
jgi:hypothetical protein